MLNADIMDIWYIIIYIYMIKHDTTTCWESLPNYWVIHRFWMHLDWMIVNRTVTGSHVPHLHTYMCTYIYIYICILNVYMYVYIYSIYASYTYTDLLMFFWTYHISPFLEVLGRLLRSVVWVPAALHSTRSIGGVERRNLEHSGFLWVTGFNGIWILRTLW